MATTNTNICVLRGNLTRDPEEVAGGAGAGFSIAVNESFKKKDEDRYTEYTNYFDVVVWGPQSKAVLSYLTKGSRVTVTAHAKQERWEDKETGKTRSVVKFHAVSVEFDPKAGGSSGSSGADSSGDDDLPPF